jgi:hypothetical protein
MFNSEVDTAKSTRWTAVIKFFAYGEQYTETFMIEEINELQSLIEDLPDWGDIEGKILIDLTYNFKENN